MARPVYTVQLASVVTTGPADITVELPAGYTYVVRDINVCIGESEGPPVQLVIIFDGVKIYKNVWPTYWQGQDRLECRCAAAGPTTLEVQVTQTNGPVDVLVTGYQLS